MLPALATVEELELETSEPIGEAEEQRAEWLLAKASALVRRYTRRTWVDANGVLTDVPDEVTIVTAQVAARVWSNPRGAIQEAAGGLSWRLPESAGLGMYLTDVEKSMLDGYRPTGGLWALPTSNVDPFIAAVERDRWESRRFRDDL